MSQEGALLRFKNKLDRDDLVKALATSKDGLYAEGSGVTATEPLPYSGTVALDLLHATLDDLTKLTAASIEKGVPEARTDSTSVELFHSALSDLPIQAAADPRFWTWVACGPGRDFVCLRWNGGQKIEGDEQAVRAAFESATGELHKRFRLNSSALEPVSRHALARLWWIGHTHVDDYSVAEKILFNQDVFQAIYERDIGLIPGLPKVLVETFHLGTSKADAKLFRGEVMSRLRQLSTVTKLETLSPEDLRDLTEAIRAETGYPS